MSELRDGTNAMKSADQIVMTCPLAQYAEKIKNKEIDELCQEYNKKIAEAKKNGYDAGYKQACIDQMNIERAGEQVFEDHQNNEKPPRSVERFSGCEGFIRYRDDNVEDANAFIEQVLDKMMDYCDRDQKPDRDTMVKAVSLMYTLVPKLLKKEEIREGMIIYCEYRSGAVNKWYVSTIQEGKVYYAGIRAKSGYDRLEQYGSGWRAWTFFPTVEQLRNEAGWPSV